MAFRNEWVGFMRAIILLLILSGSTVSGVAQITSRQLNLQSGDTLRWTWSSTWAEPDGIPEPTVTEYLLVVDSVIGDRAVGSLKEYGNPPGRLFVVRGPEVETADEVPYELNFAVLMDLASGEVLAAVPDRVAPLFRMMHRNNPDPPSDSVFLASSERRLQQSTWPQMMGNVPFAVLHSTDNLVVLRDTSIQRVSQYSADPTVKLEDRYDTSYTTSTWTRTAMKEEGADAIVYDAVRHVVESTSERETVYRVVFDARGRTQRIPRRCEYQNSNFGEPGTLRVRIERHD